MPGTIRQLEDLNLFQVAREINRTVSRLCMSSGLRNERIYRNQVARSAFSVISNVCEGFERDGNREFIQFLSIAKGSAGELRGQTYVICDAGFISEADRDSLLEACREFSRMAAGMISYLRSSDIPGLKHPPSDGQRLREILNTSDGYTAGLDSEINLDQSIASAPSDLFGSADAANVKNCVSEP